MSGHGFTSAFATELDAYLAFKASMGFFGASRIWYLKKFDAYCAEHHRTVFDKDTVEGWVNVQLQRCGRYRSWMSYIRDVGRWMTMNGSTDAYVLSDRWKASIVAAHPYLLSRREIELFFVAAAQIQTPCPWRWQATAFFTLMHSCGLRTGETRALQTGQVDLDTGHIDIIWSKGHRSRRLPLTDQVVDILDTCDRISRAQFASRRAFSSPLPATRSVRQRSGRYSAVSGTRRHCPAPWQASSRGPTISGIISPTPISSDG
jgi:integrase